MALYVLDAARVLVLGWLDASRFDLHTVLDTMQWSGRSAGVQEWLGYSWQLLSSSIKDELMLREENYGGGESLQLGKIHGIS